MSKKPEDEQCPACGYYCNGKGGFGCIDKPSLVNRAGPVMADKTDYTPSSDADEALPKRVFGELVEHVNFYKIGYSDGLYCKEGEWSLAQLTAEKQTNALMALISLNTAKAVSKAQIELVTELILHAEKQGSILLHQLRDILAQLQEESKS